MTVRNDYLQKIEQIKKFAEHYYHKNESLVSDQAYDLLVEETARAGEENGWTDHLPLVEKVASGTIDYEADIEHKTRMLSLNKVNSEEDLEKFIKKLDLQNDNEFFVIEPKLDGLAFRVFYNNGKRELVSSRGDSYYGKNLTLRANELKIEGLPKTISSTQKFEVRGELFITNENYAKVQQFRTARWAEYETEKKKAKAEKRRAAMTAPSKPFSLQRSAVSGSINAKPGTDTTEIILSFAAYDVLFDNESKQPDTYIEALDFATENGILTALSLMPEIDSNLSTLEQIEEFGKLRNTLSYPTDGSVVKANYTETRKLLGAGEKHPNWAVAYKYEEEVKPAVMAHIERSVGKSGAISYVGIFEKPVELSGSQVSRATLNNADMIKTLDIRIGDTVMVRKANGIIPEVLAVRIADREKNNVGEPYEAPTTCPQCSEHLDTQSSIIWRCHNPNCSKLETIIYAISKKNLDIQGLGRSTVETLVEQGKISDVADLFSMAQQDWENLIIRYNEEGKPVYYGKTKTATTMKSLDKALETPLEKIISSLNIRFVGSTFGRRFAKHYGNFNKFVNTNIAELTQIEGVKDKAQIIVEDLKKKKGLIEKYETVGFTNLNQYENKNDDKIVDQKLANENIVITGAVPGYTRDEIKTLISDMGGKPGSSVSSKTTLVVAPADERETSKAKKAQQLGITIITPEEFLQRIQ